MKQDLELLISTMNRKDLSFLESMFPEIDTSLFSILIINQTELDEILVSSNPKIRVINSREFGLSKSRNLAIENAVGDILVFADDDIQYLPGFEKTICQAYNTYDQASLISFQFLADKEEFKKKYPTTEGYTTSKRSRLFSIEITFKRKDILEKGIRMNEYFGLGSSFPCAEEQIFKQAILNEGLKIAYVAVPIVIHFGRTTGFNQAQPDFIRGMTAQKFLMYRQWTYLWLIKFVFFLFRHKFVSFLGQIKAYRVGMKAISELKKIENEN